MATLELPATEMPDAVDGLQLLKQMKSDRGVGDAYSTAARKRWPDASVFAATS